MPGAMKIPGHPRPSAGRIIWQALVDQDFYEQTLQVYHEYVQRIRDEEAQRVREEEALRMQREAQRFRDEEAQGIRQEAARMQSEAQRIRQEAAARMQHLLVRLLTHRFGALPSGLLARIQQADTATLAHWADCSFTAESLDDVFA
jgi:hypothetical protein